MKRQITPLDNWLVELLSPLCPKRRRAWEACPGYRGSERGYIVTFAEDDDGGWSIGIVFASVRCATIAAKALSRAGITPAKFAAMTDEEVADAKRTMIEALPW
jgi:hypothetical protein